MSTATVRPATYGLDASIPRFSLARYQRMIEAGILTSEDMVELLENYVVLKMPRNPRHDSTIQRMLRPVLKALPAGWDVRVQSAVTLADSQPEPDFALVRGSAVDYETRHPGAPDIGVLIEVADASLLRDQRDKVRIYARAGIPIYWIVNLVEQQIEAFSLPTGTSDSPEYHVCQIHGLQDALPLVLDSLEAGALMVADLLPK